MAKAAKAKQVKLVAAKTLELEDEKAKLEELATAMANAKQLADEKFAEEEKETASTHNHPSCQIGGGRSANHRCVALP